MLVPAPLIVEVRKAPQIASKLADFIAIARCDGAAVSSPYLIQRKEPRCSRHMQWARAFLEGVLKAPVVVGVRS